MDRAKILINNSCINEVYSLQDVLRCMSISLTYLERTKLKLISERCVIEISDADPSSKNTNDGIPDINSVKELP